MAVIDGRQGLEQIPMLGCIRHLRTETIGRVAVMVDGHPEIFPVNYAVDEQGDIFFRTDRGSKLDAIATAPTVAFEIDGIDEENQLGWSVLAVGPARWLGSPKSSPMRGPLPYSRGRQARKPTWFVSGRPRSPVGGSSIGTTSPPSWEKHDHPRSRRRI